MKLCGTVAQVQGPRHVMHVARRFSPIHNFETMQVVHLDGLKLNHVSHDPGQAPSWCTTACFFA